MLVCGVVRAPAVVSGSVVVEVVVCMAMVVEIGVVCGEGGGGSCRCLYLNHGELFHLSVIEGRPDVTKIQRVVCLCPRHCVFISSGEAAWWKGTV